MLLNKALPFCRGLREFWYAGSGMTNGPMRDLNLAHHASLASGSSWERNAVKFDGSTGYAESVAPTFMDAGYGDGTKATFSVLLNIIAYPTSGQVAQPLGSVAQTAGTDTFGLFINSSGNPIGVWHTTGGITFGTSAYNEQVGASVIPLATWTLFTMVRNGTAINLYVNGAKDTNVGTADTNPFITTSTTTRIGGEQRGGQTRTLNGHVRMASIHARSMSDAEVKNYADEVRRGFPSLILRNGE